MGLARKVGCCVVIVATLVTVGCGSGGAGTTAGGRAQGGASGEPPTLAGIKGERLSEHATNQRISPSDCAALARLAERQTGRRLTYHPTPHPPLSRCRIEGHGVSTNVYLDSGFAAHKRYENRIVETDQFGVGDPSKTPHAVPNVGEKQAYEAGANWVPALNSLLAERGNRWLTVTISVAGRSNHELRNEAAVLARAGFKLTAR